MQFAFRGIPSQLAVPQRRPTRCCAAGVEVPAPTGDKRQQPLGKKVSLVSLGCPKNVVDGEVLLGDLTRAGFSVTDDHEQSDAIIVNTCAFVEDAKSESLEAIVEAASLNEDGKRRKVVITGCLAQRYSDQLASDLPEADLVVGFQKYGNLAASLQRSMGLEPTREALELATAAEAQQQSQEEGVTSADAGARGEVAEAGTSGQRVQVGASTVPFRPEWDRYRLTPRHSAYLRVAEGCNHACTFCAIPGFRGKFRSKPWQAVLDEARHLVANGVKELNLIAEDTNQYGMDRRDGRDLAQLLRELSQLEGLHWIRILYAYPSYFNDALIDEIATNPKARVCKYLDMPLQHISNLTLLAMNRPPREHTLKLLTTLRTRIPSLALRTTFISGFPGETDQQHRELVEFVKTFKFERMGCFAFSEEDGTPAASLPDQVPQRVRERRRDELISLQQRIGEEWAEGLVGREVEVLVEGYNDDDWLIGRTQWDAPDVDPLVFLTDSEDPHVAKLEAGQIRRCVITSNSLFDLEATPIV
ncbi:hypothetical protein VOLCADRAFT_127348 [Volvox carteri f. nagariensis]|uniref:Uncharacterized protein n=1 Tax=Volvox carteri f. nagariensis TaxID=3068 RepID=D8THN9_VOLCA|nr:uncharacterized protein VOLCADRAFT_127348 [Volvox carteri f. nagariensis]EFJ53100.1 hypothetical protein VOLCADRAFT_127348 [Volvox carteri f. nagariensis]|eukprot:XP_002946105.1 hypothetical protein VOLCADRAFT_127348 [Volvox carteri f. nagariensis]